MTAFLGCVLIAVAIIVHAFMTADRPGSVRCEPFDFPDQEFPPMPVPQGIQDILATIAPAVQAYAAAKVTAAEADLTAQLNAAKATADAATANATDLQAKLDAMSASVVADETDTEAALTAAVASATAP